VRKNSQIKETPEQLFMDKEKPKGNILYMAPEVMKLEKFNEKADIYRYAYLNRRWILWEKNKKKKKMVIIWMDSKNNC